MKIYKPPTADHEKLETVTVLSIDGGGSRDIIPAVVLGKLEKILQEIDKDDNVRISDYFDVISGSGMGSIIAGMLTVPDDHNKKRPRYSMQQILDSLINEIFSTFPDTPFSWLNKFFGGSRPQDKFRQIIRQKLNETQLNRTLSNVVIPVFDDKNKRPVILSSSQAKEDPILLYKAVLGSSAIPTFLDPLKIRYQGEDCSFIDGGLVSTNPTLFALQEADKLVSKTEADYKNYLVLSLGTAKRRGVILSSIYLQYLISAFLFLNRFWIDWGSRILQYAFDTFSDTTEIYMTQLLKCNEHGDNKNYLRIQARKEDFDANAEPVPSITDGSSGGLNKLKKLAYIILKKPVVKYINPYTGDVSRGKPHETNEIALKEFAEKLKEERQKRVDELQKKSKV